MSTGTALNKYYNAACLKESDIFEHLPTLYKYARQCQTIVECGVRTAVSTWAFAKGLHDNGLSQKKLIGVDLVWHENIDLVAQVCRDNIIEYHFAQGDSAKIDLPRIDLLFIDTWHVYGHLKRELAKHASQVNRFIILHDTTVDAELGESIRERMNIEQQARDSGYPIEEIKRGLWPAVTEFLLTHPEWCLIKRYTNCNGLTVLGRNN
jgi:hypothetical protein